MGGKRKPVRRSATTLKGLRVLVVDDEPMIRRLVREFLSHEGAEISEAGNIDELTEILDGGERPNVIVLDLSMPGKSGWTALPRLLEQGDVIPVVILTAHADVEFKQSAIKRGVSSYLTKPFRGWEIVEAVLKASGNKGKDPWASGI